MKKNLTTTALFICLFITIKLQAQTANISIQGVLRTAEGSALENGEYDIAFKLYTQEYGSAPLWEEEIIGVQVKGGVYSVVLGNNGTDLDVKFDEPYFLGVTVEGGIELTPRAKLTSSPYALSLIGDDNIFPNSGNVGVGADDPQHKLTVQRKDAILGLEADSNAIHTATIMTTINGMQFDAGGADNIYAFPNGRIDATAHEQFTIEGTDDANVTFSKNSGNASFGFSAANGDDLAISNNITNGKIKLQSDEINLQSDGTIALTPNNSPVTINKNGDALQLIGIDHTFMSFYPEGNSAPRGGYLGFPNNESSDLEIFNEKPDGDILLKTDGGRVNINSHLRVDGFNNYWLTGSVHNSSGGSSGLNGTVNVGIASSYAIQAPEFYAVSDQRIKKDFVKSNGLEDLAQLNKIEVTNYSHIDTLKNGTRTVKGLIAQQVKSIFPEAVMLSTEYIPSIYSFPTQIDLTDQLAKFTLKNPHDLKVNDKVKIITPDGNENMVVQNINDEFSFSVAPKDIEIKDQVFIYGKEVDDFHAVDYDRVFTLAVSATQELARKVEALETTLSAVKKENAALKNKSTNAEQDNVALKAELRGMNKRLQAIELTIDSSAKK